MYFGGSLANDKWVLEYLMKYKAYLKWWFLLFKGFIRENDHGRVMDWFILQIAGRDARWMCSYLW